MTFEQFKQILNISERLTGIQYSVSTRQEVMDLCSEFFDDGIQYGIDDDHYYAILKDGSYTSDHDGICKRSSLNSAKKITFTSGWGTVWFIGRDARKDEQYRCNGHGTDAIEALKRIRCEKDGFLYCAAESERCSHLYERIGRQTNEDPWCSLDLGFGVFCLG